MNEETKNVMQGGLVVGAAVVLLCLATYLIGRTAGKHSAEREE